MSLAQVNIRDVTVEERRTATARCLGGSRLGWQLCTAGVGLVDGDGAQQRRLEVGTATVSELDPRGGRACGCCCGREDANG
jgi:hypothetical protein